MVSRAGSARTIQIHKVKNGAAQSSGTIFDVAEDASTENTPAAEQQKFEDPENKTALKKYNPENGPTPISIVKEVASTEEQIKVAKQRMDNLIEGSDVVLFKAQSVFPFDFFPDHIIIDAKKVSIVIRQFFWSERVHSVMIETISDVFVDTSPFFSALKIVDKNFQQNVIEIRFLHKKEAARARRIIQGLMVAVSETLDVTHMNPEELIPRLEQLGKVE
jgi:hypothetical protein